MTVTECIIWVGPIPGGVNSEIFLYIACPEKRKKWVVFHFKMRSAFLLQNGVLKKSISAYLIKNVALNFVVCSRVGVLGTKNLRDEKYRKPFSQKNTQKNGRQTSCAPFHELQLQLYLSLSILRAIDYCAFRSQK